MRKGDCLEGWLPLGSGPEAFGTHTSHIRRESRGGRRPSQPRSRLGNGAFYPKPASCAAAVGGRFRFPLLLPPVSSRGTAHLDWKYNTRRTTSAGMVRILSYSNKNLRRRFLASISCPSHTPRSFLPRWNIFGVDLSCQGGLLMKGKTRPMMRGSNMGEGQNAVPAGTSNTMSAAL